MESFMKNLLCSVAIQYAIDTGCQIHEVIDDIDAAWKKAKESLEDPAKRDKEHARLEASQIASAAIKKVVL